MIEEVLGLSMVLVLGYFLLPGTIAYIATSIRVMLLGVLASVIGFMKVALGSLILLIVMAFMGEVYKRSSESKSNADIEAVGLSVYHLLAICIIFLVALRFCPLLLKCLAFALFFYPFVRSLAKMNDK